MVRFILITILLILIARAFWRVVDGVIEAAGGRPRGTPVTGVKLVRDPVCGTYVAQNAALSLTAKGRTQYFCSEKCRDEFGRGS